ncbi:hypothetical protein [Magnetovibrio blakemorei]|uniref:Uncharacterized protein n=1 Tax=Magnetovibrio blakemorei TaxID=28181 RepID=A0A1E5QBW9_9PROT|nr:hypothetical protein [Magnetovibrio blakemorei]OEJ69183.1 hypothetical protein BEN30_03560 [Magnetovibrio blakemorei]
MADISNISAPVVRPVPQRSSNQGRGFDGRDFDGRGSGRDGAQNTDSAIGGTGDVNGSARFEASKGYAGAGDVSRRANVMNEGETPQNQASLARLKRILSSDQPLRGDVPRGFYLDLRL